MLTIKEKITFCIKFTFRNIHNKHVHCEWFSIQICKKSLAEKNKIRTMFCIKCCVVQTYLSRYIRLSGWEVLKTCVTWLRWSFARFGFSFNYLICFISTLFCLLCSKKQVRLSWSFTQWGKREERLFKTFLTTRN